MKSIINELLKIAKLYDRFENIKEPLERFKRYSRHEAYYVVNIKVNYFGADVDDVTRLTKRVLSRLRMPFSKEIINQMINYYADVTSDYEKRIDGIYWSHFLPDRYHSYKEYIQEELDPDENYICRKEMWQVGRSGGHMSLAKYSEPVVEALDNYSGFWKYDRKYGILFDIKEDNVEEIAKTFLEQFSTLKEAVVEIKEVREWLLKEIVHYENMYKFYCKVEKMIKKAVSKKELKKDFEEFLCNEIAQMIEVTDDAIITKINRSYKWPYDILKIDEEDNTKIRTNKNYKESLKRVVLAYDTLNRSPQRASKLIGFPINTLVTKKGLVYRIGCHILSDSQIKETIKVNLCTK